MAFFKNQFANVVEWEEFNDETLFWKWTNKEIKKGSRLIIRPGQDAIFLFNGKVEGVFTDEGSFDIETEIVPFLSTLKGFKFGFNTGMRAEVLFINTKEINVRWGTKNAINIPTPALPGGMPIRCFGTFDVKVSDYMLLIDKIAGIKQQFTVDDVKDRVISMLDQLLMKWIVREGKDMFNLQANAFDISAGIREDLDQEMEKIGIAITSFAIASFSYPEEVQRMQMKAAGQSMVGDVNKYAQIGMADGMEKGGGGNIAGNMMSAGMGMAMGQQMMNQMGYQQGGYAQQGYPPQGQYPQQGGYPQQGQYPPQGQYPQQGGYPQQGQYPPQGQYPQQGGYPQQGAPQQGQPTNQGGGDRPLPKFCPECGTKTEGAKFCPECGTKF